MGIGSLGNRYGTDIRPGIYCQIMTKCKIGGCNLINLTVEPIPSKTLGKNSKYAFLPISNLKICYHKINIYYCTGLMFQSSQYLISHGDISNPRRLGSSKEIFDHAGSQASSPDSMHQSDVDSMALVAQLVHSLLLRQNLRVATFLITGE